MRNFCKWDWIILLLFDIPHSDTEFIRFPTVHSRGIRKYSPVTAENCGCPSICFFVFACCNYHNIENLYLCQVNANVTGCVFVQGYKLYGFLLFLFLFSLIEKNKVMLKLINYFNWNKKLLLLKQFFFYHWYLWEVDMKR